MNDDAGRDGAAAAESGERREVDLRLRTRRADLAGRTPNQVQYLKNILGHDITFGIGPAGTGKTYLAVACAVDAREERRAAESSSRGPRSRPASGSAFCPATWRRRSTRTCARSTTRSTS